jgi:hypothetical protein
MQFGPYLLALSLDESGVWSLRIPGGRRFDTSTAFPADCPHRTHFHGPAAAEHVAPDTRSSQHIAGFCNGLRSIRDPGFPQTSASASRLTVIVTAAVHWGFDSRREPLLLTFQHWAGVSPYTSPYGLAETYVFGKQSPGPAHCGP